MAAVDGFSELEARLVTDEVSVLLPGLLEAVGVRWVDPPWVLQCARLKAVQLSAAHSASIAVPETLVTGDPVLAREFARDGSIVAKALSTGHGIAPYVGTVPECELHRLEVCPTLLQRLVSAKRDSRVVTVGALPFGWIRERREGESPDWRSLDPAGSSFRPARQDATEGGAVAVADALGLSFSVQDWLLTDDGPVFLEVNPQGQWLFLRDADQLVVPPLVEHLTHQ